jgi:hypothetical protein
MSLPLTLMDAQSLRIGLVIGSYAAIPYIHLQLETRKRLYPSIPMLVQDDCSPCQGALKALCDAYGADFQTNSSRIVEAGDLRAYSAGMDWARNQGINLLYKFSRRFLPVLNWSLEARGLALASQAATYSSYCAHCKMGFRTECIGFHVPTWIDSGLRDTIEGEVAKRAAHFVEGYMHNLAQTRIGKVCQQHSQWVIDHPVPGDMQGYARPAFMGVNRFAINPFALWHDVDSPLVYYRQARTLGITDYFPSDFEDPNSCTLVKS